MIPEDRTPEAMTASRELADLQDLRALPPIEPPAPLAERVRAQAHRELAASTEGGWLTLAVRGWTRVGLPMALTVTVLGYLAWAMSSATALYR